MDLLAKLNEKIEDLIKNYESLKEENEKLKLDLQNTKQQLEEKEASLLECQEAMALKELELEEVLAKIEAILGK
ncbi:hypothetical protein JCM11957_07740 [Caminibacter profundus]